VPGKPLEVAGPSLEVAPLTYALAGGGALLAAALPRLANGRPFNLPLAFLGGGFLVFLLPLGLPEPDPMAHRALLEHTAELVVIVSLMGAGLALDRPVGWRRWGVTWRLIAIAMPLTIAAVALLAGELLGLPLAAALLLGAVLAPTDPVLAADVQVGEPSEHEESEDEVRFGLTSEAGLNDGAAFPFVYLAIVLAAAAAAGGSADIGEWFLDRVLWATAVGIGSGLVIGRLLGRLFFRSRLDVLRLSEHADGFVALAATFLAYGITELLGGYGFLAVFVAACSVRAAERTHGYHHVLHGFTEQVERLLTAWVLLLLGGAIATGLLSELGWREAAIGIALVFVIRPAVAWVSQLGARAGRLERLVIASYGIRGIGSIYYLAYALGQAPFPAGQLWAVVGFTITLSVVVHGVTASPVVKRLDVMRERRADAKPGPATEGDVAQQHI
jgi:NhaP-type Na+/H+ or K+/H+ antiporter